MHTARLWTVGREMLSGGCLWGVCLQSVCVFRVCVPVGVCVHGCVRGCVRACVHTQTPGPIVDRQTGVKTLLYPKLHLRAVNTDITAVTSPKRKYPNLYSLHG